MTTTANFGHGKATRSKLSNVTTLLPMLLKMSNRWVNGNSGTFYYIEANAGPGEYEDEEGVIEGSPVVALRSLVEKGLPYHAILIDRDIRTTERLKDSLQRRGLFDADHVEILHANNEVAIPYACQRPTWTDRGMVFFDEKGAPKFDLIDKVMAYRSMRYIDVLVNIPTVTLKLMRRCVENPKTGVSPKWQARASDTVPLIDKLHILHKQRVLVGEPSKARWAWSLLFGSNWDKGPKSRFPDMPKHGLYATDTELGRDCLERISYSARERAERAS